MRLTKQGWSWHIVPRPYRENVLSIASAARNCYQSDLKSFEEEENFVRTLIKNGHHSPLEHISLSLRIITDRGVSHELVRHRLSSFSQESTRYVKYETIEFILPVWFYGVDFKNNTRYLCWEDNCKNCELNYHVLLELGQTPQQARTVLNHSVKTEIVMTCNIRQWRTVLQQRTVHAAHPQMRELMTSILTSFKNDMPCFFEDL